MINFVSICQAACRIGGVDCVDDLAVGNAVVGIEFVVRPDDECSVWIQRTSWIYESEEGLTGTAGELIAAQRAMFDGAFGAENVMAAIVREYDIEVGP